MPKQRSKRRNRANDGDGDKSYLQVGRVLEVLDQLKDKPLTTPELASALKVGERTVIRFMGAMSRYGWPVLYHKTNTSEQLQWGIDVPRLVQRLTRGNSRRVS